MTRIHSTWLCALFVGFLTAPWICGLLGVRASEFENRPLRGLPSFSWSSTADVTWYADISESIEDHLPLRQEAIHAHAWIMTRIFQVNPHRAVVAQGVDGWLFLAEDFRIHEDEDAGVTETLDLLGDVLDHQRREGRPTWIGVCPNKTTLYPELLRWDGRLLAGPSAQRYLAFDQGAEANHPAATIDFRETLLAAKQVADQPIYHQADTHWTPYGAMLATRAIVDALSPGTWDDAALNPTGQADTVPDMTTMMGIPSSETFLTYEVARDQVVCSVERIQIAEIGSGTTDDPSSHAHRSSCSADASQLIEGTTVILFDSFGRRTQPYLAPYLEESWYVSWDAAGSDGAQELVRGADRVVMLVVERHIFDPEIHDALRSLFGLES
jgi:alginate O-acetyltransferase complex protein AlgJ